MLSNCCGFVLFLTLLGSGAPHSLSLTTNRVLDIETFLITNSDVSNLASIVLKFFEFRRCTESNLGTPETCAKLSSIPRGNMNVYIGYDKGTDPGQQQQQRVQEGAGYDTGESEIFAYALEKARLSPNLISKRSQERGRREKVFAVLPDSNNIKVSGEHDIILVIDPYPGYNFGHFLGLFYLDLDVDPGRCEGKHQIYMPDRVCFSVARKPRCREVGDDNSSSGNRFHQSPKCFVDFLPTVRPTSSSGSNVTKNLLECINLPEFGTCPRLSTNVGVAVSHSELRTRCRLFQRCDRGILIGGGWNPLHSTLKSEENVQKMKTMLLSNGFLTENLRAFYGNFVEIGAGEVGKVTTKSQFHVHEVKAELRRHITKICRSKHCADTLFIYLNSPTTSSGNFLLWDLNNNGMADDQEVYTTDEFLSDISKCDAQRVIIVADQSRTDILVSLIRKSNTHQNVVFSAAGLSDQPTRNGELTTIWANHSHPMACLKHIQQAGSIWMKNSTSTIFDASGGSLLNLSISGAPCGDMFSKELRPQYQGCQNLPTSIWFGSLKYGDIGESSEDEQEPIRSTSVVDGKQSRDARDSNVSYIRRLF